MLLLIIEDYDHKHNMYNTRRLGGNSICNAGAVAIATALKSSTCLKELQ